METINLTEDQIYRLAYPLSEILTEFYKDEKNMEGFRKWMEKRKKEEKEVECIA